MKPKDADVPLIKRTPKQVPLGFSTAESPLMIAQIQLAKDAPE